MEKIQPDPTLFQLVIESSPSGLIMVDRKGKIKLLNKQVELMFGYKREELVGQSIEILMPESFRAKHVAKRVARTLLDLSQRIGKTLSMTKREIAELAGTSVETSIRTLSMFERKHWISSTRGEIRLIGMEKMKAFLE